MVRVQQLFVTTNQIDPLKTVVSYPLQPHMFVRHLYVCLFACLYEVNSTILRTKLIPTVGNMTNKALYQSKGYSMPQIIITIFKGWGAVLLPLLL